MSYRSNWGAGWMAGAVYSDAANKISRLLGDNRDGYPSRHWRELLPRAVKAWIPKASEAVNNGLADWVRRDLHMWLVDFEYDAEDDVPAVLRSILPPGLPALVDDPRAVARWTAALDMYTSGAHSISVHLRLRAALSLDGTVPEEEAAQLFARVDTWIRNQEQA